MGNHTYIPCQSLLLSTIVPCQSLLLSTIVPCQSLLLVLLYFSVYITPLVINSFGDGHTHTHTHTHTDIRGQKQL